MWFIHTPGKTNVADVLTKYLPWCDKQEKIGPVLFWKEVTLKMPPSKVRGVTGDNHNLGVSFPTDLGRQATYTNHISWSS